MSFLKKNKSDLSVTSPGRHMPTRLLYVTIIFFVIAAFMISILFVPISRKLVIIEERTGRILKVEDVKPRDVFVVSYTHSVNKSPVDDVFEIQPDYSIVIKKTVFRSFGAGIPYELEDQQILRTYNDRIEVDNINRTIDKYLLFVGTIADHTFTMHQRQIHLNQLTQPQNTVRFEVRKVPLYVLIRV